MCQCIECDGHPYEPNELEMEIENAKLREQLAASYTLSAERGAEMFDWKQRAEAAEARIKEAVEHGAEFQACNPHPDAPHGFCRNASHNAGRYVCECEGWKPEVKS